MSGRQDKGPGQIGPKLLSAHRFFWASWVWPWDRVFCYAIDFIHQSAGTRPLMSRYVPKSAK